MNDQDPQDFEQAGRRASPSLVREFWQFLKENKKYWLIPPLVALLLLGLLVWLGGTAAAPFIYSLF
jgi:hypothetical protein